MKFCQNCGKKIKSSSRFCPYCGTQQYDVIHKDSSKYTYNRKASIPQKHSNQHKLSWSFKTEFHTIMISTITDVLLIFAIYYGTVENDEQYANNPNNILQQNMPNNNGADDAINLFTFLYIAIYIWTVIFFIRNHKSMPHFAHTCTIVLMILPVALIILLSVTSD